MMKKVIDILTIYEVLLLCCENSENRPICDDGDYLWDLNRVTSNTHFRYIYQEHLAIIGLKQLIMSDETRNDRRNKLDWTQIVSSKMTYRGRG